MHGDKKKQFSNFNAAFLKVLNICQMIMDEMIPDERAPRDFRAKFPDDVLQENLAGQLWFGAEVKKINIIECNNVNKEKKTKNLNYFICCGFTVPGSWIKYSKQGTRISSHETASKSPD